MRESKLSFKNLEVSELIEILKKFHPDCLVSLKMTLRGPKLVFKNAPIHDEEEKYKQLLKTKS